MKLKGSKSEHREAMSKAVTINDLSKQMINPKVAILDYFTLIKSFAINFILISSSSSLQICT